VGCRSLDPSPARRRGTPVIFSLTVGIKADTLPAILPARVRRFRAAGRRGEDRCLTATMTDRCRERAGGPRSRRVERLQGLQECLKCECLLSAAPTPGHLSPGRRWKARGPSLSEHRCGRLVAWIFLLKCRPPKRPHEPSTVPSNRAAASGCPPHLSPLGGERSTRDQRAVRGAGSAARQRTAPNHPDGRRTQCPP
jgi:hypothetical protein